MSLKKKKIETTLNDDEEKQHLTMNDDDELGIKETTKKTNNNNNNIPFEIIEDILSRLPVKPLLRFRSVSKQWLSLISDDPSFHKLHLTRSFDRTSFFISAYDTSTREQHFLSAPLDGGPVTHLVTLHNAPTDATEAEHLHGLVLFTSRDGLFHENFAFVVNPATRKVFKVPPPPPPPPFNYHARDSKYFFGFDESNVEHKILSMNFSLHNNLVTLKSDFMIFSLSTYSWRHVDVDLNLEELPPISSMLRYIRHSVCVNSVIHLMLYERHKIFLAFDLTTEKFSSINLPRGAIPREIVTWFDRQGGHTRKYNGPFLIKDNELLGVVCHDVMVENNEMQIWMLRQDNRVWVRETVTPSEYWIDLDGLEVTNYPDMADLMFSCRRLSRDMVNAFILDRKAKSFKLVNFSLGYPFLHSKTVNFHQVRSYVESFLPLRQE